MTTAPEDLIVHVSGKRPSLRELAHEVADVAKSIPLFATAPLIRRWHRTWGAVDEEAMAVMPGDELVPDCQYVSTRAITIDAPPERVWPWLVQVGFGRAGFYSNDLLDNVGHPSADHIVDRLQHIEIGDWVPMFKMVNDATAFKVAAFEPAQSLVWAKPDSTWAWKLLRFGAGTRLITRLRILYDWRRPATTLMSLLLNEVADFAMMRRMLLNIRRRAESHAH